MKGGPYVGGAGVGRSVTSGSLDVETRMVGSELTIFSNIIGAFTISVWQINTQAYGDLLGSPQELYL